ncbi:BTAD domain-containing putative transcriptional regulator [Streptomyces turgidiscabies]|uniref:Transcriptional regulatory protein, C-terminal domain protein n=2 Tax=Streptomyces TaxID=1883 RepID=L7FKU5_STRT8|nr:BTAD domain-containing putative transcriptional regulator [Streptomyces turgidiscabies]ELP71285.1 transcriptional regulatory protein, C-terminal domain protein [Streptomyces turgidiscabies Car8]MDX3498441.1 BTAD domain-containing putative transcriptional regulator [Streptomyces turgidiscabies]GAQ74588.1 transcriptional regulatory protein EmbR [Streptomyces turgidiscabies]
MQFRLLGPLEVENDGDLVDLGGRRQRAVLAYLLLHANQVVSTTQLLSALWPDDAAPMTARKILQNAVWKLRGVLARPPRSEHTAELLTRPPGYLLRVPPRRVDLLDYRQRVAAGRAALTAGQVESAHKSLREALSLWRGPVLADLVEEGICWPELTAVQNRRLNVMEDLFEAALACGRHQLILRDLENLVASEPLRERASGQLMVALYRCGRQAEALAVFGRVRAALVEGLGLEPGRELHRLQQAILTHDPSLEAPRSVVGRNTVSGLETVDSRDAVDGRETVNVTPAAPSANSPAAPAASPATVEDPCPTGPHESRTASVVMFRFRLGEELGRVLVEDRDRVLDALTQVAREKAELHGGRVTAVLGSTVLAVFAGTDPAEAAEHAVRTAAAVRDSLSVPTSTLAPPQAAVRGLTVHAAVVSGEALLSRPPSEHVLPPWVGGRLVETCRTMLDQVQPGEIHVCEETRRQSEEAATFRRACASAVAPWELHLLKGDVPELSHGWAGAGDQVSELELTQHTLLRTRQRSAAHLITLIDDSGRARTRLLMEFQRRVEESHGGRVRVLAGTVPPPGTGSALSVPAEMLAAYCGIDPGGPEAHATARLRATLDRLGGDPGGGDLYASLASLLRPGRTSFGPAVPGDLLRAWTTFLARAAREQPLVVIWDDLQYADDALLDVVEQLTQTHANVPLLNVVGADGRLPERRPGWATGRPRTVTISLTPEPGDDLNRLLESLLPPVREPEVV